MWAIFRESQISKPPIHLASNPNDRLDQCDVHVDNAFVLGQVSLTMSLIEYTPLIVR